MQAKSQRAAALREKLLREIPGCTWLLRPDLTFEAVYGAAARILGRSAAELEKMNFAGLFTPSARPIWIRRAKRAFAGETISAPSRFGDDTHAYAITLFPVHLPEEGMVFAGGTAHEMPERDLFLRSLETVEAERSRLARFLHDHVGQGLSAAGLQLDLLRMELPASASPGLAQRATEIQAMLETVMGLVRGFNCDWSPAVAERLGLRAALDELAGCLRSNFNGNIRVLADASVHAPPHTTAALYRIAQEAAAHAACQPGCSVIELLLKSLRSGAALEVRDNAPGFDVADGTLQARGVWLLVIQHYADQAGIELEIDSAPDRGTVVRAIFRPAD